MVERNQNNRMMKITMRTAIVALAAATLFGGCSKKETSSEDLLHRIATDASELKRRGYKKVTITESGWVVWAKDGWQGMASPTIAELKPGETIKTPPITVSR